MRECYAHTMDYESDKLVEIVMVDSAFVVELLLRNFADEKGGSCRIFNRPNLIMKIISDIMLLENQLPMFLPAIFSTLPRPSLYCPRTKDY